MVSTPVVSMGVSKMVVSMLSWSAIEKSSSPYIESIVEPCVSKNQKEIFAICV